MTNLPTVRIAKTTPDLRARLAESEAENDQWQKKLAEVWAENARLRAALERIAGMGQVNPARHVQAALEALSQRWILL